MAELLTSENLIALLTLAGLEIVLGIDNIVFISILVAKLPEARQAAARSTGFPMHVRATTGIRTSSYQRGSRATRAGRSRFRNAAFETERSGTSRPSIHPASDGPIASPRPSSLMAPSWERGTSSARA